MSIFLVIFTYALWSSSFPLGKLALLYSSPLFLNAVRMLLAAFLLLGYWFLVKRGSFTKKQLLPALLLGFFNIYLTNVLEFWGLKFLTASKTCFIYSLSPFFSALFSYLHFKEKMNLKKCLGMVLSVAGVIPVIITQTKDESLLQIFSWLSWPTFAVIGASIFSVYSWVLLRVMVKNDKTDPVFANGSSMLFGGVLSLAHYLFVADLSIAPISSFVPFCTATFAIVAISNLICYNLYGFLLKKFTATFLSLIGVLSPVFASLNSWLILGEKPDLIIFPSLIIVFIGLFIVYKEELAQGYILGKPKDLVNS